MYKPDCEDCPTPTQCIANNDCTIMRSIRHSQKDTYVPPEQRLSDHAPFGPSELEYLERLCELGEGLLHPDLTFSQAENLLVKNAASVVFIYDNGIRLIKPTARGMALAAIVKARRNAWKT